jgi:hypothetical protein
VFEAAETKKDVLSFFASSCTKKRLLTRHRYRRQVDTAAAVHQNYAPLKDLCRAVEARKTPAAVALVDLRLLRLRRVAHLSLSVTLERKLCPADTLYRTI